MPAGSCAPVRPGSDGAAPGAAPTPAEESPGRADEDVRVAVLAVGVPSDVPGTAAAVARARAGSGADEAPAESGTVRSDRDRPEVRAAPAAGWVDRAVREVGAGSALVVEASARDVVILAAAAGDEEVTVLGSSRAGSRKIGAAARAAARCGAGTVRRAAPAADAARSDVPGLHDAASADGEASLLTVGTAISGVRSGSAARSPRWDAWLTPVTVASTAMTRPTTAAVGDDSHRQRSAPTTGVPPRSSHRHTHRQSTRLCEGCRSPYRPAGRGRRGDRGGVSGQIIPRM